MTDSGPVTDFERASDFEAAVRTAVRDLADEGRPVDLGGVVLARMRRRERVRVSVAAGLAGAALLAVPLLVTAQDATPPAPPAETAPATAPPWPAFAGLGRTPARPAGPNDRLVVAGYSAVREVAGHSGVRGTLHVLDPATGAYRAVPADTLLAVSPDLRYALVMRHFPVRDETGSDAGSDAEYGIYDTVADRVLGRLDVDRWVDGRRGRVAWTARWSPDGRTIALSVRLALTGRGYLGEQLVFVDVATGAIRAVDIAAVGGYEPFDLLGWTADGRAVAVAADRAGTDEVPSAHLVYDLDGRALGGARRWSAPAMDHLPVTGTGLVALIPFDGAEAHLRDLRTGEVVRSYPAGPLLAARNQPQVLGLAWRGDDLILLRGAQVVAVDARTGASRALSTLPLADAEVGQTIVAPAGGLTAAAAGLAW